MQGVSQSKAVEATAIRSTASQQQPVILHLPGRSELQRAALPEGDAPPRGHERKPGDVIGLASPAPELAQPPHPAVVELHELAKSFSLASHGGCDAPGFGVRTTPRPALRVVGGVGI
jgi:hypothetical protein